MARYRLTSFCVVLALAIKILAGSPLKQDVNLVSAEYDGCHIPNEAETGVCVKAKDCEAFQAVMMKEDLCSNGTLNFIRAVQCESTSETRVCCPQSNAYKDAQLSKNVSRLEESSSIESVLLALCYKGQIPIQERVNEGKIARIDEFLWAALLFYRNNRQSCGGVLITRTFVMTAAHCLAGPDYPQLDFVRLGEYNTETNPDCTVIMEGSNDYVEDCNHKKIDALHKSIKVHPNYNPHDTKLYNDIGLIELDRAVNFTDFLEPATLPRDGLRIGLEENAFLQVCGWGRTNFFNNTNGNLSTIKLKASLPFVNAENCTKAYESQQLHLGPGRFCAGGSNGKDSCTGDSGSSLVYYDRKKGIWVLSGIVSQGPAACGTVNMPGIYTNVRYYLPWILKTIL